MEYAMSGVGFVILTITADLASSGGPNKVLDGPQDREPRGGAVDLSSFGRSDSPD